MFGISKRRTMEKAKFEWDDDEEFFSSPEKFTPFFISNQIKRWGLKRKFKANRPQCNGKNERVNQTLVAKLRCKVNSTTKTPWTKLLEQVTYEYNNSPHDVTGFPPAYLMFGTLPYDSLPNQVKLNYPPIQQARQIAVNRTIKHHKINKQRTATAGLVQSGRPIFDDFFQHLWPYIGNNTANVVFQMVKRLWLIRIDQCLYIASQKIV
ncbi:retrotransposable element Tf2 protein type 1 [Trichonephila clavipes]|nr:retrotransposable element Tf2 protein type 1 [Trichonephila clavipes]